MNPMISLSGLTKTYDGGFQALKRVDLDIRAGEIFALDAYRLTGETLGVALAELAAILDPAAFVISGGLAAAGELLLGPARATMEARMLPVLRGRVELRTSAFKGAHAALLGLGELGLAARNLSDTP